MRGGRALVAGLHRWRARGSVMIGLDDALLVTWAAVIGLHIDQFAALGGRSGLGVAGGLSQLDLSHGIEHTPLITPVHSASNPSPKPYLRFAYFVYAPH